MAEACEECGGPLSFGIGQRVRRADGTEAVVCVSCAQKLQDDSPAVAPGQPPGFTAPRTTRRAEPAMPRRSRPGLAIAAGLPVLALGAVGALGYFLLAGQSDRASDESGHGVEPVVVVAVPAEDEQPASDEHAWDGTSAFRCGAGEQVTLKGKRALDLRTPIRADGDCRLTIIDCELAGDPAVDARDQSHVVIRGGRITGKQSYAVRVWEGAKLEMSGTKMAGGRTAIRIDAKGRAVLSEVTVEPGETEPANMPAVIAEMSPAISMWPESSLGMDRCRIRWNHMGVDARSRGRLALRDTVILVSPPSKDVPAVMAKGSAALSLRDGTVAVAVGGQLAGPGKSVVVGNNASLTLEAVELEGDVDASPSANVAKPEESSRKDTGLDALLAEVDQQLESRKAELDRIDAYGRHACQGVIACYEEHDYVGEIAGLVKTTVDAEGNTVSTSFEGKAPAAVRACIQGLAKGRTLPGFEGPAGVLECEYSGRLLGGGRMLSMDGRYVKKR